MLNPILFLSALFEVDIDNHVEKIDKCSISGIVNKIEIKQNNECLDNLLINIKGEKNYLVNSKKLTNIDCEIDGYYKFYNDNNLLKQGDFVNLLVDKNNSTIISDNLNENGYFTLISGNILNKDVGICEGNSFVNAYFLSAFILLILFILFLLIVKKK